MTISLRINEIDGEMIKAFAEYNNETTSSYIRRVVLSDIEEEYYKILDVFINSTGKPTNS